MRDSISLMKSAAKNVAELLWCAKELQQNVRPCSKAALETELLCRCVEDVQNVISLISSHMDFENLEFKLKLSDTYGKNVSD